MDVLLFFGPGLLGAVIGREDHEIPMSEPELLPESAVLYCSGGKATKCAKFNLAKLLAFAHLGPVELSELVDGYELAR